MGGCGSSGAAEERSQEEVKAGGSGCGPAEEGAMEVARRRPAGEGAEERGGKEEEEGADSGRRAMVAQLRRRRYHVSAPHLANPTIKPRCYSGRGGGFYP